MRGGTVSGVVFTAERARGYGIGQGKPAALKAGQRQGLCRHIPTGQADILGRIGVNPGLWHQLREQRQGRGRIGSQKDSVGVAAGDGRLDAWHGGADGLLAQRISYIARDGGTVGRDRLIDGVAAQLACDVIGMQHNDPVAALTLCKADQTVGGVAEGWPEDKDVTARDGRVVRERQDIHAGL